MAEINKFTWIPFYEEMAQKLFAYKDCRDKLVEIVYSLGKEYTDYIYAEKLDENGVAEKDDQGKKIRLPVNDIDPFSVMAIFNRKILDENRIAIIKKFKDLLKIEADIPDDFDSIPILMNLQSTLYWRETASSEIPILWELFDSALHDKENFGDLFDELLKYKGIKWNITIALYWCFPQKFVALDSVSRDFLKKKCGEKLENEKISYSEYQRIKSLIIAKFDDSDFGMKNFSEFSDAAYQYAIEKQQIWIAGGSWNGKSYTEDFYKNGYWEGGPGDSETQLKCLKDVKKGDLIALKTREGIFEKGKIPNLEICYVGIVDEDSKASSDDKWFTFKVRWFTDYTNTIYPQMYKKPYNGTICKCVDKKILRDLISFAEEGTLFMTSIEENIKNNTALLKYKHNIILQGAPGTGKTYATAALALSVLGVSDVDLNDHEAVMQRYNLLLINFDDNGSVKNNGQIGFVTFHQSMDYEDFVEGIKPLKSRDEESSSVVYDVVPGIFKSMVNEAKIAYVNKNGTEEKNVELFDQRWNSLIDKINEHFGSGNPLELPTKTDGKMLTISTTDCSITLRGEKAKRTTTCYRAEAKKLWDAFNGKRIDEIKNVFVEFRKYVGGNITAKYAVLRALLENVDVQESPEITLENAVYKKNELISLLKNEDFKKEGVDCYVLIIDEINRGNVSKIFGELISLLESDKRDGADHPLKVTLPYSKDSFSIPSNLYIIGTMNTTDRSVGSIDYAVRRRFAFVTLEADENLVPEGEARDLFKAVKNFLLKTKYDMDIEDLMVGHSYFMNADNLSMKWQYEILPLLMEYHKDGIVGKSPLKDPAGKDISEVKKKYENFTAVWKI